ncbi:hypothetical protein AMR41_12990 [Hapalosiphon sp. MRB220]|nr:hypothetical protein AMR41_12990 [Hapalosiphon sp. MRB220]
MQTMIRFLLPLLCFIPLQQAAFAQVVRGTLIVSGVAKTWRLENYVPDNVVIWYSGSACASGQLILPASATKEDRDRLFTTVSLSKTTDRPIFVNYVINSGICNIVSFGMLEQ